MRFPSFIAHQTADPQSWRALTVFAGYRLFLAAMLFFVCYFDLPPDFLGESNPDLYDTVSLFYLFTALVLLVFTSKRWGKFESQTLIQLVIDIVVITLIFHTSGGLKTGLGSLLVVVVVAGGALVPGRLAAFIAAIATLSVLLEASYAQIAGDGVAKYSHAGMLGATFFATALLAQTLAKKMQQSQVLAEERGRDVAKLALLNEHIISRLQTGVLVIDAHGRVTLSNESASAMLGLSENNHDGEELKQLVPQLAKQLWNWNHHQLGAFTPFQARVDLPEVLASATILDSGEILVYIENTSATAQQAQQLKLASLGRLTASIAHEIRNPLGAISHAGEILAETYDNDQTIKKLTNIIQRHSERVNGIIETILQMSRRKTVQLKMVVLAPWLSKFVTEFREIKHIDDSALVFVDLAPLAKTQVDAEQLQQVLWNLLENAWHYSDKNKPAPQVKIELTTNEHEVNIDISDNGDGVSEKALVGLFEPFHSQRQGGTGLGLYLARELCQANGARLNYLAGDHKRCCFRISFPLEEQEKVQ